MSRNYSEKETKEIVESYLLDPSLDMVTSLSVKYRKTRKSIIAKLSKEGVYQRKVYTSKTGQVPITKLELVARVEDALGIKLPGLDKTQKTTLLALQTSVTQLQHDFDILLEEYDKVNELANIRGEMMESRKRY